MSLSPKGFWDAEWQAKERDYLNLVAADILRKYLPGGRPLTYFEVGCAPGSVMCFFAKVMGYKVAGIDFSSPEVTRRYLASHGVDDYRLYVGDFTTTEIQERFDVVGSFGFIEHFTNYREIIDRHARLVNGEGYLVLQLPNLRYFNWFIYRLLNPALLALHNLEVMNVRRLRASVKEEFTILFCGYYKTCFLSFRDDNPEMDKHPALKSVFLLLKGLMKRLGLENRPSRFFSPYMILIATRHSKPIPP